MTTPADLAAETGRSEKRVRAVLRELFGGALPTGVSRWDLTDEQTERARARLRGDLGPENEWTIPVGETLPRRAIHRRYGGQQQGGISTPTSLDSILVFTDPKSGARYGYDVFEGRVEDGSYWYTGEGQVGPMEFKGGNKAIRDSAIDSRSIRLLLVNRTNATYIGEFITGEPTYKVERARDRNGDERPVIVFKLIPKEADMTGLPLVGGAEPATEPLVGEWRPPAYDDVVVSVDEPSSVGERVVTREEFRLQRDFGEWLQEQGDALASLRLAVSGTQIEPDLYVPTRNWIVEAKRSSARGYVRTAIGQVLDYVHVASSQGTASTPVILLPGRPETDLADLVRSLGITLAYRAAEGFELVEP